MQVFMNPPIILHDYKNRILDLAPRLHELGLDLIFPPFSDEEADPAKEQRLYTLILECKGKPTPKPVDIIAALGAQIYLVNITTTEDRVFFAIEDPCRARSIVSPGAIQIGTTVYFISESIANYPASSTVVLEGVRRSMSVADIHTQLNGWIATINTRLQKLVDRGTPDVALITSRATLVKRLLVNGSYFKGTAVIGTNNKTLLSTLLTERPRKLLHLGTSKTPLTACTLEDYLVAKCTKGTTPFYTHTHTNPHQEGRPNGKKPTRTDLIQKEPQVYTNPHPPPHKKLRKPKHHTTCPTHTHSNHLPPHRYAGWNLGWIYHYDTSLINFFVTINKYVVKNTVYFVSCILTYTNHTCTTPPLTHTPYIHTQPLYITLTLLGFTHTVRRALLGCSYVVPETPTQHPTKHTHTTVRRTTCPNTNQNQHHTAAPQINMTL